MAQNNVRLNAGRGGDLLATFFDGAAEHQKVLFEFFDAAAAVQVGKSTPLPVDAESITAAKTSLATSTDLAATSSTDLDSAQISSGTTGQLLGLMIASSVPLKAVLKTVLNAVESSDLAVFFTQPANNELIKMPSKLFFTQAESVTVGLDGFRVTVTNLDGTAASDVYCTFFYDEV